MRKTHHARRHDETFTLGRRDLLRAGAGLAAGAALGGAGAAAAQGSTPVASPVVDESGYYPSGVPGIPDAYTKFPEVFRSVDEVPGSGGKIVAMVMIYSAPATGMDSNQYWQGLNERLGVTWEPIQVPNASYGEKASAIIASGDMPDMFYLNFNQTLTPLQKFVKEGAFLDLTDYLTGDALQQYPNLAAFPDFMWEATRTDGRIYGVPCPSGRAGQVGAYRKDWSDELIGGLPTNADEAMEVFTRMTSDDPDGNGSDDTWGLGRYSSSWDQGLFYPMFRAPNGWRAGDDGSLVNQVETEEWAMAVEFLRALNENGAFHPDSAAMGFQEALELFQSGRVGLHADGGSLYGPDGFINTIRQYQPEAELIRLIPFGHDGGEGVTYNLPGIFGFTAIPFQHEGNDEKIHELLRIFNWLSAPYGSEEWLYKNCGIEGTHFEFDENGFPITNDLYAEENGALTAYIGGAQLVNAVPESPEIGPLLTEEAKAIHALGIDNPVANLYSETAIAEGGTLSTLVADTISNVITGRDDLSALEGLADEWRSRGGDQIRAEYEEAYAASQG
jgi:putative aldouronate transport system substrate-binding protein